jgi:hypothetical protein
MSFSRNHSINVCVTASNFKGSLDYELHQVSNEIKLSFKGGTYLKNFPPQEDIAKTLLPILSNLNLSQFFGSLALKCNFYMEKSNA